MRSREVSVTIQVGRSQMQAVLADIRQCARLIEARGAVARYPASRWLGERGDTVRWVAGSGPLSEADYSRLIALADPDWMTKWKYRSYTGPDLDSHYDAFLSTQFGL